MMAPPPQLRETILAQAELPVLKPRRSPWVWILGATAAAATVLSLALGLSNHRLRLANQQLQQELLASMPAQQAQLILQQPSTRFYDFEGTGQAADAFGSMIVDTDGLRAAIAFKNLPSLSAEQTYALWVITRASIFPAVNFKLGRTGLFLRPCQCRPFINLGLGLQTLSSRLSLLNYQRNLLGPSSPQQSRAVIT